MAGSLDDSCAMTTRRSSSASSNGMGDPVVEVCLGAYLMVDKAEVGLLQRFGKDRSVDLVWRPAPRAWPGSLATVGGENRHVFSRSDAPANPSPGCGQDDLGRYDPEGLTVGPQPVTFLPGPPLL